ncbi:DNA-directed RNA polymerase subunit beta [Lysinibacillus sp. KU-BSD001]|uniref:DNA-directed RNA polymerase subunit beta n=1 Tax=Lysinibacillus sp. KU-BSD001 TaxID=3141328 RepID=UPI0036EB733F
MTNELNHTAKEQPKKKRQAETPVEEKSTRWVQIRLIPIWLRIILVLLLFIVAGAIGVVFGYSVIGEGNASDALKWSTWEHILDILNGKQ